MEYMKITGFLGGIFSKFINKAIMSKTGVNPNIRVNDMSLRTVGSSEEIIQVQLEVTMRREEFERLVEEVTK